MKRVAVAGTVMVFGFLLAGCYDYNEPDVEVHEIPRDEAWSTVNANLSLVVPNWDASIAFPEHPLDWPPSMTGCEVGDDGRLTGPPWSLRAEETLTSPDAAEVEAIGQGFAALESQGYEPAEVGESESAEDRHVENSDGYSVQLRVGIAPDGTETYELSSTSPCIRFEGDDSYN